MFMIDYYSNINRLLISNRDLLIFVFWKHLINNALTNIEYFNNKLVIARLSRTIFT